MSKTKSAAPPRRRRASSPSDAKHHDETTRASDSLALRDTSDRRPLLARILDTPHLAQVVPRLQPEVLHRIIQSCGLEDCGEIVGLATPDQLVRVFDIDLWHAGQPGLNEQFDADRFGVWLEVLVEADVSAAAQTVADMDVDLVIAALAQHARVFDLGVALPAAATDDEVDIPPIRALDDGPDCRIGGYSLIARRADSWDAIVAVLIALDAKHQHFFHRVMRGCRSLSNAGFELDGLNNLLSNGEQVLFNLASDREQRRDKQGYVTPAQARAFLQMSRQIGRGPRTTPPVNPVASAYFRAIESTTVAADGSDADQVPSASGTPLSAEDSAEAVAAVVDVLDMLVGAGVIPRQPLALLGGPQAQPSRLGRIQAQLQFAGDRDPVAFSMRTQELAYLANTILAGCSIQERPFTVQEASDAAVAVCNLGLENWPAHWLAPKSPGRLTVVEAGTTLPDDFLVGHDLVSVFQVGWTVLHEDVGMYAADQLVGILTRLRCEDPDTRTGLTALRIELKKHWRAGTPWHARGALEVIEMLDMLAWAALVGLIDECPVMPAAIAATRDSRTRTVSASAFEFISENSQIAAVREFMASLPETLRP